ncbi:tRNA-intron lyase [Sulfurisphaera tokodaii]|uniref:tRNA-splicing endonuclease n=2 Tax=Sulfurisphaera tokodaii TaxID=111955 RepID=ENDA_SULTO|nr:tRNA-intron lyase [Sulfurisphaera tokodaii]Q975R3.1 RecName: Full=tRNA-splicing endonuclease; AltName: Full=tRNA-intron endonuclease [Sulfurisphaera tokodaii str. 7]BAK54248.1 RNA splicing endonuclease alpha subunit [Sulfurisphaera tokodaii str. 7]HII74965.1 tRNA-intron lyase [Sulfurisphaera tokodaii]
MIGELVKDKILIKNIEDARLIYKMGYYGKPIGISKPKSAEEINSELILSLIEGVYLVKKGKLEIVSNGERLDFERLYQIGVTQIPRFRILYSVYEDLREKGYVVRSGIKYGADFAVYTIGPGIEHAPYLVIALDENSQISSNEILGFGRVSHSTRKELILGIVNLTNGKIRYIMFKWLKM